MRKAFLLTLALLVLLNGCGQQLPQSEKTTLAQQSAAAPKCTDRYQPLRKTPWAASHLAFNTVRGEMCRSWGWSQPNNIWAITPENTPVCGAGDTTPQTKQCPDQFQLRTDTPWTESHLASDLRSGRLCRTWDWEQPNNMWGITRENTPMCASLARPGI